jgi:hypothetical protein
VGLLLAELICRLIAVDYNPNPNWRYHPVLGWTQEPGGRYDIDVEGHLVHVQFNSLGFRDVEHTFEKPQGTKRIILVGDSFSEAIQVNLEETFWWRLQRLLNSGTSGRWEVINLGVGDFGTAQELITLTEVGLAYSPDIILVQIFPLNDICNNNILLAGLCKSDNDPYRPYFVPDGSNLILTWNDPLRHQFRQHSMVFGLVERSFLRLTRVIQLSTPGERHRNNFVDQGFSMDPLLLTFADDTEQGPAVSYGWEITELLLERIDGIARQEKICWLPVVIPFEARVRGSWDRFVANQGNMRLSDDYPETRLGTLFERLHVPCVFLKSTFEQNPKIFFPSRGGHLNPQAHELAAQEIYAHLLKTGWIRQSPEDNGS